MYKILYCVSTLGSSGPTNQLLSLIKHIDRSIFEIHLVTLSKEPQKSKWLDFEKLGVVLYPLNISRLYFFIKAKFEIMKLVSQIKPDIIHTQGIRSDYLISKLLNKVPPHVLTAHNQPFKDFPMKFNIVLGYIMACFHIKIMKNTKIISCSKSVKNNLMLHGVSSTDIQNGVDISKFKPIVKNEKTALRKSLDLDNSKKIFIAVGALTQRKNMVTIVKAFNQLSPDLNYKLIILGHGNEFQLLKNLTKSNPCINLLGNVDNVNEYLQASDCFISASLSEGLPYSVLEAMAINLNCILSDISSHKELFEINEKAGDIFFEPKNIDSLVKLIQKQLYNDNECSNRQVVLSNFDEVDMSKKYQRYYLDVIKRNPN